MSRTDVHRPEWVQHRDPQIRRWCWENHRHHLGPCDLQEYLTTSAPSVGMPRCYLTYHGPRRLHGCPWCNQTVERRWENHQVRSTWRADARAILKTLTGDRDAVDVAHPRRRRRNPRPRPTW